MSPWINYHHLYYFKVIAEEGSVSKAAEKLLLGQPTLSAQLKQFEDALGVALFERKHKRLILSEQGKVALDYARNIFKLGNEMYEVLHDKISTSRVHLQIGALDSIAKAVTFELTQQAHRKFQCSVSIREGRGDEILRELMAHRIDLFVTNFIPTVQESKSLAHRSVARNAVSIYGAPQFKDLKKKFPQSIQGQPFIMPTYDSKMRYDIEHWLQTRGIKVDTVVETQDVGVKELMCIQGMGLMPSPRHTVTAQVQTGKLVEIGSLDGVVEEIFLVSAHRKVQNPVAMELMLKFKFLIE